jgi:hypothetical protein
MNIKVGSIIRWSDDITFAVPDDYYLFAVPDDYYLVIENHNDDILLFCFANSKTYSDMLINLQRGIDKGYIRIICR